MSFYGKLTGVFLFPKNLGVFSTFYELRKYLIFLSKYFQLFNNFMGVKFIFILELTLFFIEFKRFNCVIIEHDFDKFHIFVTTIISNKVLNFGKSILV